MKVFSIRKMMSMVIIMIMMISNMAKSELHYVGGGKTNWAPNVNMSEWSSHEKFHVNDWLYFGFDKHMYNVLEVNKTSYENCIDNGFIKNITRGGRDVFQLTEAKTYYFLSGGGYCWQGMKVAIKVVEDVSPTPQLVPPKSASSSYQVHKTFMMLIFSLMWGINFK